MTVTGLDGRSYAWSVRGRMVGRVDDVPRSGLHLRVRAFLRAAFPTEALLEEVPLPGSGGLSVDFYLPLRRTAVEAQGVQHGQRSSLFHPTAAAFHAQQDRDRAKARWLELNGIRLVELWHDEDESAWETRLSGSTPA